MNRCSTVGCKGRGKYWRNGQKYCFQCQSKITHSTVCPIIPQEIVIVHNPTDMSMETVFEDKPKRRGRRKAIKCDTPIPHVQSPPSNIAEDTNHG